jgi:hypothetical protein
VAGAASAGPFGPIAGVPLFASGAPGDPGVAPARDRSDARGDVLGTRRGSAQLPRVAQLSPLGPLDDTEQDGPALAILAALLAATLAVGVLALRLGPARGTPDGPPEAAAERDPRDWQPPPPPWSRD